MAKCRECKENFTEGEYIQFGICDDCLYRLDSWPIGGEECSICGGTIIYIGNMGYEQLFECDGECERTWRYD
jgi:hypothetical protein